MAIVEAGAFWGRSSAVGGRWDLEGDGAFRSEYSTLGIAKQDVFEFGEWNSFQESQYGVLSMEVTGAHDPLT